MIPTISRNAFLLAAFAIICTAAVAVVNHLTQPMIMAQQQKALLNTINQLIPVTDYDNDIFATCFMVKDDDLLGMGQTQQAFIAKRNQQPVAIILETSTFRGYAGEIKLVLGIYENGEIAGVRAINHTETPGLGDKIQTNKSDWILSFDKRSYLNAEDKRWEVKRNGGDFDAFTGATITPRAVVLAVKDALIYFEKNKQSLFSHAANCGDKS